VITEQKCTPETSTVEAFAVLGYAA